MKIFAARSDALGGWQAVFLFSLFVLFAMYLMTSPGTGDVVLAQHWIDNVAKLGFRKGFEANQADYPPLSSAVLWFFSVVTRPLHMDTFWVLKTACLTSLIATSATILFLEGSVLGAILVLPVFMLESTGFAYLDIFYTPFLIAAFWALRRDRLKTFSLCIAAAALIKWQPLIICPFLLAHLVKDEKGGFSLKRVWPAFYPGLMLGLAVLLYYGSRDLTLAFNAAMGHHFLSGNAFNLGWIVTYYLHVHDPARYGGLIALANHFILLSPDNLIFRVFHSSFTALFGMTILVFVLRRRNHAELLLYSATGLLCYFMINPGAHENHSYVAALLLFLLAIEVPKFWPEAAFIGVMLNTNLIMLYGLGMSPDFNSRRIWDGLDLTVAFALLNLLFFGQLWLRHVAVEGWRSYRDAYLGVYKEDL